MLKSCKICGKQFNAKGRDLTCSPECRTKYETEYHRKWVSEHLEQNRKYMREYMRTGKIYINKGW